MKIAKKGSTVNQSSNTAVKCAEDSKYAQSKKYIKSAIDALGEVAKDDVLAREAIANLSVVLFDLD